MNLSLCKNISTGLSDCNLTTYVRKALSDKISI